jgi:hypothetical protein
VGGRVTPLAGPLHRRPVVDRCTAAGMLRTAVEGLSLGAADEALLARYTDVLDPGDTAVLASLIERARRDGPSVWAGPDVEDPATGWVPVCAACRARALTGAVGLAEAESAARAHDVVRHGGAWTCEVVPAAAGGAR